MGLVENLRKMYGDKAQQEALEAAKKALELQRKEELRKQKEELPLEEKSRIIEEGRTQFEVARGYIKESHVLETLTDFKNSDVSPHDLNIDLSSEKVNSGNFIDECVKREMRSHIEEYKYRHKVHIENKISISMKWDYRGGTDWENYKYIVICFDSDGKIDVFGKEKTSISLRKWRGNLNILDRAIQKAYLNPGVYVNRIRYEDTNSGYSYEH